MTFCLNNETKIQTKKKYIATIINARLFIRNLIKKNFNSKRWKKNIGLWRGSINNWKNNRRREDNVWRRLHLFLLQKWKGRHNRQQRGCLASIVWSRDNGLLHPVPHCALFLFMPNQQHGTGGGDIEKILQNCDTFSRKKRGRIFFSFPLLRDFHCWRGRWYRLKVFLILAKGMNWFIVFILPSQFSGDSTIVPEHTARSPERRTFSFVHIHQTIAWKLHIFCFVLFLIVFVPFSFSLNFFILSMFVLLPFYHPPILEHGLLGEASFIIYWSLHKELLILFCNNNGRETIGSFIIACMPLLLSFISSDL